MEERGWDFRLGFEYRKSEKGRERDGEIEGRGIGMVVEGGVEIGMEEMWMKWVRRRCGSS